MCRALRLSLLPVPRLPVSCLLGALLLGGCASFPTLDARLTPADLAAPVPALQPIGPVLAAADAQGAAPPADLSGRVAALTARAAALRGQVIDSAIADRIAAAVR